MKTQILWKEITNPDCLVAVDPRGSEYGTYSAIMFHHEINIAKFDSRGLLEFEFVFRTDFALNYFEDWAASLGLSFR